MPEVAGCALGARQSPSATKICPGSDHLSREKRARGEFQFNLFSSDQVRETMSLRGSIHTWIKYFNAPVRPHDSDDTVRLSIVQLY